MEHAVQRYDRSTAHPTDLLLKNKSTRQLIREQMMEVVSIAQHLGVKNLDESFVDKMIATTDAMTPYSPSMRLDSDFHRPMEIYYLYTRPLEIAREAGCRMPKLEMLEAELRFLEAESDRLNVLGYSLYSRISPGWQSRALQMASRVEKRMALALPVLRMERLAWVIPIRSASSCDDILRRAIITSTFTMILIGLCRLDGEFLFFLQILTHEDDLRDNHQSETREEIHAVALVDEDDAVVGQMDIGDEIQCDDVGDD